MNSQSKSLFRMGVSLGTAVLLFLMLFAAMNPAVQAAPDDGSYQIPPFSQDWSNISLITDNNDWSAVPGILGYRDNAVQAVALHYRVGNSGNFTNLPGGFVADATEGPNLATLVTPVSVTLPAAAANQPMVQLRIMTTNAVGNDEWVGIDDLTITTGPATPDLAIVKSVDPATAVPYQSAVTYTVVLENSGSLSDTNVLFTDTLPISTTFGAWVEQPAGAAVNSNEITWSGTVTNGESITFTFTADQTADYGETITNTAAFSGTTTGTAQAGFTVESLTSDITFVYHDAEDVVQPGEAVHLAGSFDGWTATVPMTADAANDTFTVTLPALDTGDYEYKYIVFTDTAPTGPAYYDWLNSNNRLYAVAGTATVNDYRSVVIGWANLQWPPTLETDLGVATANVYGRLHIPGVTNTPTTEGRGLKAQVGYGSAVNPASWDWFPMSFQGDDGPNNDEFVGVITPTMAGVFSYTTRFDGNWGVGNPNAAWTYGDLDGIPFELTQTGVLTVEFDAPTIIINEVDADTPGTDTAEFLELYDGGTGNTPLDGLVLVFYNGSNDTSYQAFDLDGQSTNANGYFVLCANAATVPNCDLDVVPNTDLIQNGQDAIALYVGNAADFPNGTAVTITNLIDAIVYDTDDADDPGLLVLLNPGQPQVNESTGGNGAIHSNQRCPDGTGGARNTDTYEQHPPTAGTENLCGIGIDLSLDVAANTAVTDEGETITYTLDVANLDTAAFSATGVVVNAYLPDTTTAIENIANDCGAVVAGNTLTWTVGTVLTGTTESCAITADVRTGTNGTVLVLDAEVAAANETDLDSTPGNLSGAPAEDDEGRVSIQVGLPASCVLPASHFINEVQGSDDASPIVGSNVTVQAVVVGDFQDTLSGFYIQEEDSDHDSDPATSEGIYVFNSTPVSEGDLVRIDGTVTEFNGLTELTSAAVTICSQDNVITPTLVTLPLDTGVTWERYEGMLLELQDLTATDNFRLGRFGQVRHCDSSPGATDQRRAARAPKPTTCKP
jgi:uncharacterized repeat protein (TIGR01451 family)